MLKKIAILFFVVLVSITNSTLAKAEGDNSNNDYQEGYDKGYEQGYLDFKHGNEYDTTTVIYNHESYEEGYFNGWEASKVDNAGVNSIDFTPDVHLKKETDWDSLSKEELYKAAYKEGNSAAKEGFSYDDFENGLSDQKLSIYKNGYRNGYIFYTVFNKYLYISIAIGGLVVTSIILIICKMKKIKIKGRTTVSWVVGLGIPLMLLVFWFNSKMDTETVDNKEDYGHYISDKNCSDFESQEKAQKFFEENGGPEEDSHDLDRDRDRIACEWN
ncbi:excalibur calcium-binding domain-containing protein [Neobacillus drentensis]|uniref:excalibur calcium-binding domain-containing protein n=1 Tax=Neobacillus drentensis TaxID=220684 RepID=UPI0030002B50